MEKLTIEIFTRAMKRKRITQAKGELDGLPIGIDLDNLFIEFGNEHFDLDRIPGTKGGYRYFFFCPMCGIRCRVLYKEYLRYGCRTCQKVHQQTLNRSKTDCQYYWGLAIREARKIDPNFEPRRGYVEQDDFPSRPKYMKSDRYFKHYKRFLGYVKKGVSLWFRGIR